MARRLLRASTIKNEGRHYGRSGDGQVTPNFYEESLSLPQRSL